MDQFTYRGYLIYLMAKSDLWNTEGSGTGWSFRAAPLKPDFPILPRNTFRFFVSREDALARAKKQIDRLLEN